MKDKDSAFPRPIGTVVSKSPEDMTKRFFAACLAMQGMLANPELTRLENKTIVTQAFLFADEMLEQEI